MKLKSKLSRYHKIFFLRFLSYFFISVGVVTFVLIIEPVSLEEIKYDFGSLTGNKKTLPKVITSEGIEIPKASTASSEEKRKDGLGFGDISKENSQNIIPVSTDFGIVIEKIGANAEVIADVDPSNEKTYMNALSEGIAHAKGTAKPGEAGNIYLFSHSVNAPWEVVRYNAVFYLLGKLDVGDRVILFYQGKRYDYIIFDKTVASANDTNFLIQNYDTSVLTLQTCDPPGTTINRLVVRAKLEGI